LHRYAEKHGLPVVRIVDNEGIARWDRPAQVVRDASGRIRRVLLASKDNSATFELDHAVLPSVYGHLGQLTEVAAANLEVEPTLRPLLRDARVSPNGRRDPLVLAALRDLNQAKGRIGARFNFRSALWGGTPATVVAALGELRGSGGQRLKRELRAPSAA